MDFGTHLLSYLSENVDLLFLAIALLALLLKPGAIKGVDKRFFFGAIGLSFLLTLTSYLETAFAADPAFPMTREEIDEQLDPAKYIGRCESQVSEFLEGVAQPVIDEYYAGDVASELKV